MLGQRLGELLLKPSYNYVKWKYIQIGKIKTHEIEFIAFKNEPLIFRQCRNI